ncbi:MAG: cytochrome P460 family protein [Proteobacteria bacterium]|nr:cytochrome P460 family protein [Pseudomonadota bacterium]MDA1357024.1 cytochrome P460 family protein [Pseudomonadota bacterium]
MKAGYAKSGNQWVTAYQSWTNYAAQPYTSGTHGGRFVNNYANARGSNYGLFENAGPSPEGTVLAKDSFSVKPNGKVGAGPMFLMEKMAAGFNAESGDWRYTLILPNGKILGTTGGKGSAKVGFCIECHAVQEEEDSRFFLDEEYRKQ